MHALLLVIMLAGLGVPVATGHAQVIAHPSVAVSELTSDEARDIFEQLLKLRNDVGLLAEQYDPEAGRMVGNFPQAFSHVGLINTARNLARRGGPAEDRPDSMGKHIGC